VASHFGGTRNGTIVHWPKGIKAKGEIRSQFHHVIDIAPTILEVAHLPQPLFVNGVQQRPIEGVSMAYSFNDSKAAERRETQNFEMAGNRGIYHDQNESLRNLITTGTGDPRREEGTDESGMPGRFYPRGGPRPPARRTNEPTYR
jgi:arylsulfatase A-like enzyme